MATFGATVGWFLVLEVTVGYAHTLKIYNGGLEHFVDHINRQIFDNYDAL